MKNVLQDIRDWNSYPPPPSVSLSLTLNPKGSPSSNFMTSLLQVPLECSLCVYIYHKEQYPAWEVVLVLEREYFKPTGSVWGQFNSIATFRALTHTK